ncbi:glutathione S-transferase family protein [Novosphingobium tardum]|uniref:Glutathione S-transferase family protein n=1 Tax=Novosphingobium tardum TaxID=1538021 RepID=A0ABV8RSW7_9SPHN
MILYDSVGPNPRVVRMFAAEKGIALEKKPVDIMAGENRQEPYLKLHPGGTTPLLVLDDGTPLSETTAICEYLEELQPNPPLIGTTPLERAKVRMLVRQIDLLITAPMTSGFRGAEGRPMFEPRMRVIRAEAADDLKAMAADGLAAIERQVGNTDWLLGPRFTLADIVLFSFVEFGGLVGQPLHPSLAKLAAWRDRVAARPSAAA